ncbi:MAG: MFS transporter [bacterium]|nr:MFS transporter [bacterium]
MRKIFGVDKNVFFLGVVSFFNDISGQMVVAAFPAFFQSVLKSGAAALGIIEGVAEGLANIVKVFSGSLSDKIEHRKGFAIAGYIISTITRPLYLFAAIPAHVFGIRVFDRIGKGIREAPRDALISLSVPREELGRSFGFHRSMDAFGSILGPLAAFFILRAFPGDFNTLFMLAFVAGVVAVLCFIFVREVVGVVKEPQKLKVLQKYPKKFNLFLLTMTILSIGNIPIAVLTLRTQEVGLDLSFIPLFYAFYSISFTLFAPFAGRMADKLGDKRLIFWGYALMCFGYLFIIYDHTLFALALGFLLLGLSSAFTDGTQRSYIGRLTSPEIRGGAYGLFNAAIGIGTMIAGALGGLLWQYYSSTIALSVSILIVLGGLVIFYLNRGSGDVSPA